MSDSVAENIPDDGLFAIALAKTRMNCPSAVAVYVRPVVVPSNPSIGLVATELMFLILIGVHPPQAG